MRETLEWLVNLALKQRVTPTSEELAQETADKRFEQLYYKPELGPAHRPLLRDVLKVTQPLPWLDIAGNTSGWGPIVDPLIKQMMDGAISVQDGVQQMDDQLTAGIQRGFK
jgi:hypothetical protein